MQGRRVKPQAEPRKPAGPPRGKEQRSTTPADNTPADNTPADDTPADDTPDDTMSPTLVANTQRVPCSLRRPRSHSQDELDRWDRQRRDEIMDEACDYWWQARLAGDEYTPPWIRWPAPLSPLCSTKITHNNVPPE